MGVHWDVVPKPIWTRKKNIKRYDIGACIRRNSNDLYLAVKDHYDYGKEYLFCYKDNASALVIDTVKLSLGRIKVTRIRRENVVDKNSLNTRNFALIGSNFNANGSYIVYKSVVKRFKKRLTLTEEAVTNVRIFISNMEVLEKLNESRVLSFGFDCRVKYRREKGFDER